MGYDIIGYIVGYLGLTITNGQIGHHVGYIVFAILISLSFQLRYTGQRRKWIGSCLRPKQDYWACPVSSRWVEGCQVALFRRAPEGKRGINTAPIRYITTQPKIEQHDN